ncbi:MAG: hypothetical protein R6V03_03390 [Kiritimatiellia bacterium]
MEYEIPKTERVYLRELAKRQAEIAALPVMETRRKRWTEMNDGKIGRPPFAIEARTFDRDFLPASLFKCESGIGRNLEAAFMRNIRHHEILNDDHVCPDTIDMNWHVWCDEFGIEIPTERVADAEGVNTAYHFDCPIKDLKDGFDMLKPSTFGVDREGTMKHKAFLEETFGDIMPVVIRSGIYGKPCLTQRLVRLLSMENFFLALYDCPDKVHGIMRYLCDNASRMCRWAEREGLLALNNGNQETCGTCYNFTTLLPKREVEPGKVKLKDMWAAMDSQETVGISPELFHELIFSYYRELADMFGLVYWGCCEPADPIWETSISRLPNLKAVSISRWADEEYMADALDGTGIVFSKKPNPNILGVGSELDEEAWRRDLRGTLEIVTKRDVRLEFVVRDVYSLSGNLEKATRAVEIAGEEIDRFC